MINLNILVAFLFSITIYSQTSHKVKFNILFAKEEPVPGVNIIVRSSKPKFGTQTDLNGNAELNIEENEFVQINYIGPTSPNFLIFKSVDSIAINIKAKKAIYYAKKKKIKTIKLQ